jgi:hypothetical protein
MARTCKEKDFNMFSLGPETVADGPSRCLSDQLQKIVVVNWRNTFSLVDHLNWARYQVRRFVRPRATTVSSDRCYPRRVLVGCAIPSVLGDQIGNAAELCMVADSG